MSEDIVRRIGELGVFPIIVVDDPGDTAPLGRALLEGGLPCAEFAFRTPAAYEAIRLFGEQFPEMILGAGTVLSIEQVKEAKRAGVHFIVTPGFNPRVVDYCLAEGVTIFPGVCTPTDVELALEKGLQNLKFFPAEAVGGVNYLKALSGPFNQVRFLPAGGIHAGNLHAYLELGNVLACGGSWMVKSELIRTGRFDEITRLVRDSVEVVRRSKNREGQQ